jgi:hypothetical protein
VRERDARRLVLARLAAHLAHLNAAYVLPTIAYAKQIAQREASSPEQQAQVRAMIAVAEETARLFGGPIRYQLLPELERANQRFAAVLIALSAWDSDDTALALWAKVILGSQREWRRLGEVATVPLLEGKANWTSAEHPVPYLAQATRNKRIDEDKQELPRKNQVPLDAIPEPQDPSPPPSGEGDPCEEAITAVLAGADPEVKAYGELVLRGFTHEEARRRLGWYKKRAQRVEVRYRRHLKHAARDRDFHSLRQALADYRDAASRTTRKVTFPDDAEGRMRGYFEHRDNWKSRGEI